MAFDRALRLRVELHHVAHQQAEARPEDIAALAQYGVEVLRAPFQPAVANGGGEGHVAGMGGHVQMREQARQVGIVGTVEDDEAGIDRNARAIIIDGDGAAVAADPGRLFINRDLVIGVQKEGAAQSGNAGAENRNFAHGPAF